MRTLYAAVLGEQNSSYYLRKFQQFDQQTSGLKLSWNWAAFFSAGIWTLYRKMYGWFCVFLGVLLLSIILKNSSTAHWFFYLLLIPSITFAIFADSIYYATVKKKIAKVQLRSRDKSRQLELLYEKGGVNRWVIFCLSFAVVGFLLSTAFVVYQNQAESTENLSFLQNTTNSHTSEVIVAGVMPVIAGMAAIITVTSQGKQADPLLPNATENPTFAELEKKLSDDIGTDTAITQPLPKLKNTLKQKLVQHLKQKAQQSNQRGAVMLGHEIRLDKTEVAADLSITQYFSFPHYSVLPIATAQLQTTLKAKAIKQACANTLRYGVRYRYIYHDKNGKEITRFQINPQDCQLLANSKHSSPIKPAPTKLTVPPMPTTPIQTPQNQPKMSHSSSVGYTVEEKHCEFKGVMTDEDYAACGIKPSSP